MPGMTMPFAVKDPTLLEGRVPGDLVTATLNVQNTDAWISQLTQTGAGALAGCRCKPVCGLAPGDGVRGSDVCRSGRRATDDGLGGWPRGGRDLHLHAVPARRLLSDDRSTVRGGAEGDLWLSGSSGSGVRLLSVSIDPEFDRPAVLKAHAKRLGADPAVWRFVVPPADQLSCVWPPVRPGRAAVRAAAGRHRAQPADGHPRSQDRRIVEVLTGSGWTTADLLAKLRAVAGA